MFETTIINTSDYANKFRDVDLEATFTAPSGHEIPFWGFFDGDGSGGPERMDVVEGWKPDSGGEITGNVWKLRFMPDEIGTWTYTWKFSDNTQSGNGSFTCTNQGAKPGVLNVDWDGNVRYLRNDQGPFFAKPSGMWTFVGVTYDINETKHLYKKFIDKGFNMLMQQGILPIWPRVRFASNNPNNNGGINDPHITIWYQKRNWSNPTDKPSSVAYATYDTERMNLFTWKRLDDHISYLAAHNIYFIPWQGFNIKRTWPIKPHKFSREKFDWYTRYAMARLAPYYNLTWNNTWESSNGAAWLKENLQHKKYDPWRRLFYQIQSTDDRYDIREKDLAWNKVPKNSDRPYWVLEDNSGAGLWWLEDKSPLEVLQIEWKFLLNASVAMPVEFKGSDTRSVAFSDHLTHKGMDYIAIAFNYVGDHFEYWHPTVGGHNELVADGGKSAFCLARPGHEYLVYKQDGGLVSLNLAATTGTFSLTRLNPFTGATQQGSAISAGSNVILDASNDFHVLHLKRSSGGQKTPSHTVHPVPPHYSPPK